MRVGVKSVRLRVVADAHGLVPRRAALVDAVARNVASGRDFLQGRIEKGEEALITMLAEMGGMERYDRRRAWFVAQLPGRPRAGVVGVTVSGRSGER